MSESKMTTMQKMVTILKEMKAGNELEEKVAAYAHGLYDGYIAGRTKTEKEEKEQ